VLTYPLIATAWSLPLLLADARRYWLSLKGELYDLDHAPQDQPAPEAGQQKA
jgi:hypothetical protein